MNRIAVIGGDGIGPEVVSAAVEVLTAAGDAYGCTLTFDEWDLGTERYLRDGATLSDAERDRLVGEYDAALLGALGDPRVPDNAHARDILLGLRFCADLYVNYRPCKLLLPSLCPLKDGARGDGIDIDFFRENTEGLYAGAGGRLKAGTRDEVALQESVNTWKGVERIVRAAFEHAAGAGRGRVTLVDKANALVHEGALWRRVFSEVGAGFPEIAQDAMYVDAMAMDLVRRPHRYEVVVTSNLFGDILSDLAAQITGGIGLAPSGNLHPGSWALFEPIHGSAPDIAGSGTANPVGAVACAGLLLDFLSRREAAAAVEAATLASLRAGVITPDLGGRATTAEVGTWIADRVRRTTNQATIGVGGPRRCPAKETRID